MFHMHGLLLLQICSLYWRYISADAQVTRQERLLIDPSQYANDRLNQIEKEMTDMSAEIRLLKNENKILRSTGGVVFIRWGRKDCPSLNGTEIVYTGIAGGGGFAEPGSAPTNLCLPHDPDYAQAGFPRAVQLNKRAHVWGAEFQYSHRNVEIDDDVPSAVCLDTKATTSIMIAAKSSCPKGWTLQYTGNLCADHYAHPGATEYTCIMS